MTHICYLLSHGFAARMVLQSDLVSELTKHGITTTVLTQTGGSEALSEYARPGILEIAKGNFEASKLTHGQISELRRYFREPMRDNPALWTRHLFNRNSAKGWIRWRADAFLLLHRMFYRVKPINYLFSKIDQQIHRSESVRQQLKSLKPDLVVSTYPVSAFESSCLLEANKLGIPTVGHLLSWDNITCKGRFITTPEFFVAWGPIMVEELVEHYQIPREKIYECGVPHFDAHLKLYDKEVLAKQIEQMGLQPDKPFLFFGMSSPIFAPNEIDIVEWLAAQINQGIFGPDLQLVVRPHPQNVTGHFADLSWLPRLKSIVSSRVGLNMPLLADDRLAWNMEQDDLKVLVNLLAGCKLCVNSGSTLSIDALMHEKPVIVTFFDADTHQPWWKSAKRIQDFPHYKKLLDTGGIRPVFSFAELRNGIEMYLDDPSRDRAGRQQAIARECGRVDGGASHRVADALAAIAATSAESPSLRQPSSSKKPKYNAI